MQLLDSALHNVNIKLLFSSRITSQSNIDLLYNDEQTVRLIASLFLTNKRKDSLLTVECNIHDYARLISQNYDLFY